ncbi:UNVERIFIED_CONTAM: hypothetical protein RMT77_003474 [Armadillidium vulgare]
MEKAIPTIGPPKHQQAWRGVTLIILCSCVLGGLFIVLSILLFCRYCFPDQEKNKDSETDKKGGEGDSTGRKNSLSESDKRSAAQLPEETPKNKVIRSR